MYGDPLPLGCGGGNYGDPLLGCGGGIYDDHLVGCGGGMYGDPLPLVCWGGMYGDSRPLGCGGGGIYSVPFPLNGVNMGIYIQIHLPLSDVHVYINVCISLQAFV